MSKKQTALAFAIGFVMLPILGALIAVAVVGFIFLALNAPGVLITGLLFMGFSVNAVRFVHFVQKKQKAKAGVSEGATNE